MGEMGFGTNIAKKTVSRPKSVYSKSCISGSQGTWTLAFCMEAIKSLQSIYQHLFGSDTQENTSGLQHTKSRKYGQNVNIRTYIPIGYQSPYNMT